MAPDATATPTPAFRASYSPAYRGYVVVVLAVTYAVNYMDRTVLAVLLPHIKREFALADWQLGLLTGSAFAIVYSTIGIPLARWADDGHRVRIVAGAIAVWSLMTAAGGSARNYAELLLARIGVATGEAGGTPPSHSIISDLFPPAQRAGAIAVYSVAPVVGASLAYLLGSTLAAEYGWRGALFALGLPGLALALLVRWTVPEPPRGHSEGRAPAGGAPPIPQMLRLVLARPSYVHLAAAICLVAITSVGLQMWLPTFISRSHGVPLAEVGRALSGVVFAGSVIGTLGGGFLATRLGRRDRRWWTWTPALAIVVLLPLGAITFVATSMPVVLWGVFLLHVLTTVYVGPTFSTAQQLVGLRMRAMASAFLLSVVSLTGLGLGPLLIGALSDALTARYGQEALRWAMLMVMVFPIWASIHYFLAGRHLPVDLSRVPE